MGKIRTEEEKKLNYIGCHDVSVRLSAKSIDLISRHPHGWDVVLCSAQTWLLIKALTQLYATRGNLCNLWFLC